MTSDDKNAFLLLRPFSPHRSLKPQEPPEIEVEAINEEYFEHDCLGLSL
jgi:hypothetical protein